MSEQMSIRHIVHEIRRDSSCGRLAYDQCEALIEADRKATVERCKKICLDWVDDNLASEHRFRLVGLEADDLSEALDAVLEDI